MPTKGKIIVFFFLIILATISCATRNADETTRYYQAETTKPYLDVIDELEVAISEHNFRITGKNKIGHVIRQRENIDFPNYASIQFCNLSHAKELLELSPHAVRHMPCNVVVYEYDNRVIVKTRLLPTDDPNHELNEFSARMNGILQQIVDFAVEE